MQANMEILRATLHYSESLQSRDVENPCVVTATFLHICSAPAVLQLNLATALEDFQVTISGETQGIPEAHRGLHLGPLTTW